MTRIRPLRLAVDREPWERHPGEGEKTYAHFAVYRDLGRARTLAQTAQTLAVSASYLRGLAAAHHWTDRAGAWDRETDRLYAQRMALLRRDVAEQDARMANAFLAKALERLRRIDPDELGPADLVRWCAFASTLRREAYGAPPSSPDGVPGSVSAPVDTPDYATLTPAQRVARMVALRDELQRRIEATRTLSIGAAPDHE